MAGGRDELGFAEGSERGQRTLHAADDGSGGTMGGAASMGISSSSKQFASPVAGLEIDEAGVGGVGVLGHAAAAQPVEHVLGHA